MLKRPPLKRLNGSSNYEANDGVAPVANYGNHYELLRPQPSVITHHAPASISPPALASKPQLFDTPRACGTSSKAGTVDTVAKFIHVTKAPPIQGVAQHNHFSILATETPDDDNLEPNSPDTISSPTSTPTTFMQHASSQRSTPTVSSFAMNVKLVG